MEHQFSGKRNPRELITSGISSTTYRIDELYNLLDSIEGDDKEKVIDCIANAKMTLRTLELLLDKYGAKEEKESKEKKECKDKCEGKCKDKKHEEDDDDDIEIIFLDQLKGKKGKK